MRALRTYPFLTALPFILLYAADEVSLTTHVEDDATGVRSLRVVSRADGQAYVKAFVQEGKIRDLLPDTLARRLDAGAAADRYQVTGDFRFVDGGKLGDLKVSRHVRLATWPILQTTYTCTDTIRRTEFAATDRDVAAAPKTAFTYAITMPGPIDQASVRPPGGQVAGNTVTWKLAADKETQDVSVSASRPDWVPQVLLLIVLLLGLLSIVRFLRRRERTTPRRI